MSGQEIGALTLVFVLLLLGLARLFGYWFTLLRQPRVIGEIFGGFIAGLIIGPKILGTTFPFVHLYHTGTQDPANFAALITVLYNLGLLLHMFLSGTKVRQLFTKEDRPAVGWIASVGTAIPFLLMVTVGHQLNLLPIIGPHGNKPSLIIVLAISVAVTSIPVIARIFMDLKMLHTRFARLVLGIAVIEDLVLWAALALATSLVGKTELGPANIAKHLIITSVFFVFGLKVMPLLIRYVSNAGWNILAKHVPALYLLGVLVSYCFLARMLGVSLVFAAFLAGFAVIQQDQGMFERPLSLFNKMGFTVFVPIYFAIVGYRLDLSLSFSIGMLALFLFGSSFLKLFSVSVGAHFAGFRGLDKVNLAIAMNARGGPGIVLASVAYDAGIINPAFYTTLVLAAILTSQAAGFWLELVQRRGWPLLSTEPKETPRPLREPIPT